MAIVAFVFRSKLIINIVNNNIQTPQDSIVFEGTQQTQTKLARKSLLFCKPTPKKQAC